MTPTTEKVTPDERIPLLFFLCDLNLKTVFLLLFQVRAHLKKNQNHKLPCLNPITITKLFESHRILHPLKLPQRSIGCQITTFGKASANRQVQIGHDWHQSELYLGAQRLVHLLRTLWRESDARISESKTCHILVLFTPE